MIQLKMLVLRVNKNDFSNTGVVHVELRTRCCRNIIK